MPTTLENRKLTIDVVALHDALTVTAAASARLIERWDVLTEDERRVLAEMVTRRAHELEVVLRPVLRKATPPE